DDTFANLPFGRCIARVKAAHEAHLEENAVVRNRFHHDLALFQGKRQRFLAKDRLAAFRGFDDDVFMSACRCGHNNGVDESAKCRKAIFCEKPLSLSLEECEIMMKAVADNGVFFQMGFMRRFDAGYAAAKRKISEAVVGTPVVFKSSSRDPYRPSLEYA